MAYRGGGFLAQQELTSVQRLRESAETKLEAAEPPIETPDTKHKVVARIIRLHGKPHFKLGGKMYAISGNNVVQDLDQPAPATEGGPGSGPQSGQGGKKERSR